MDIDFKNRHNPVKNLSTEEQPKLELKKLLDHLQYSFLGTNNTLSVIIVAYFLEWNVKLLLEVLRKYIEVVRWTIIDILVSFRAFALIKLSLIVIASRVFNIKGNLTHQ